MSSVTARALASVTLLTLATIVALASTRPAVAQGAGDDHVDEPVRELLVPLEQLNVILEGPTRRVLLPRSEYEALLAETQRDPERRPPRVAAVIAAEYTARLEDERARITGTLDLDVLAPGLHAVGLSLGGVGLVRATLDDADAPIGRADDGRLSLFVRGVGRHRLTLELVAPLPTDSARQVLDITVPTPAATSFLLTAPGDVEAERGSGADGVAVAERAFDPDTQATTFRLVPAHDRPITLVMTLNSRLKRTERLVVARSVAVAEVTEAVERLHTTVSLSVLHRAVEEFRFRVPEGFDIIDATSPKLARWTVLPDADGDSDVLLVRLREPTTGTVVIGATAQRTTPRLQGWTMPLLEPLESLPGTALLGLLVDERLRVASLDERGLSSVDTAVLAAALPGRLRTPTQPEHAASRTVAAWYAPSAEAGAFDIAAGFERIPPELRVRSNLLLTLSDTGHEVHAGITLAPRHERLFSFSFSTPEGWHVQSVTDESGAELEFRSIRDAAATDQASMIHVPRLDAGSGVASGQRTSIYFTAVSTPPGWLERWESREVPLPIFRVQDASRETGAVAVLAENDLEATPLLVEGLTALDEDEMAEFGLGHIETGLAYRFDAPPYRASFDVTRSTPRLTARSYSFLKIEPGTLSARYELEYVVTQARTRTLSFLLPVSTPEALSITGLEGIRVKGQSFELVGTMRKWTAVLEEPRVGVIGLAIEHQQPIDHVNAGRSPLPIVLADDVVYQSGVVSVEGSPELSIEITGTARPIDVGELVDAQYQPGRRLLGVWEFLGRTPDLQTTVTRNPEYALPPGLVRQARLVTSLAAEGIAVTEAAYSLSATSLLLQISLPADAELWTVLLDGEPTKPQREGDRLLLDLPAPAETPGATDPTRTLAIVYEAPTSTLDMVQRVELTAPQLAVATHGAGSAEPIPVADLIWHLLTPEGYRVLDTGGSVETDQLPTAPLAVTTVARWLFESLGGAPGPVTSRLWGQIRARAPMAMSESAAPSMAEPMAGGDEGGFGPAGAMAPQRLEDADELGKSVPATRSLATEPRRPTPAPPPPPPADAPLGGVTATTGVRDLLGARSLTIAVDAEGERLEFQSLGRDPRLLVTLGDRQRLQSLAWTVALLVLAIGLIRVNATARAKTRFVITAGVVATAVAVVAGRGATAHAANAAFYAAAALVPLYLLIGIARWVVARFGAAELASPAATSAAALVLALGVGATPASAQDPDDDGPPVDVPEHVIIVPYDGESPGGVFETDQLLVPYARYVELWNLAHPERPIGETAPPVRFALAAGGFSVALPTAADPQHVVISGEMEIDVYVDEPVAVPLPITGAVIASADVDDTPARLSVVATGPPAAARPDAPAAQQRSRVATPTPPSLVMLHLDGTGRHRLRLALHAPISRSGGWHIVQMRLPAPPATSLAVTVPEAATEVRLDGVTDRTDYETTTAGETIRTALDAGGALRLRWRQQVGRAATDLALRADSDAVLDVREDGLALHVRLSLEFPRSQREDFSVRVPGGYVVEAVQGINVRGWRAEDDGESQLLQVTTLKPADERERFVVHLRRPTRIDADERIRVAIPAVIDASLQSGRILLRRSPALDVRTISAEGATRIDVDDAIAERANASRSDSPLGTRPYEAYRFASAGFSLELAASPVQPRVTARVQTIIRLGHQQRLLESRITVDVRNRPLHRLELEVPTDLDLERVTTPGIVQWSERLDETGARLVTIILRTGALGETAVLLSGRLGGPGPVQAVAIPRIAVPAASRQDGWIAVQADPAFDVAAERLVGCESTLIGSLDSWLASAQRGLTRLALRCPGAAFSGVLTLSPRVADVSCRSVSNVRVTEVAFEDTVLLEYTVRKGGVREVAFLLPDFMENALISVPLLRRRSVEPAGDRPGWVRVILELQDEVLDSLLVLIEHDRPITETPVDVPIPVVETGEVVRRYAAIENAGRDEVIVDASTELQPLGRQQAEWRDVTDLLSAGLTEAYVARGSDVDPVLQFHLRRRQAVQTAGARIGLAETLLVLDANGVYRARQIYHVDNSTEQYLQIELPPGAEMWSAIVAGAPVKPATVAAAGGGPQVRLPLVKTAAGDLDYEVVIKYGGTMRSPGALRKTEFPLLRSINLNVELSQVRLLLPETMSWHAFSGTMGRAAEAGQFEAGILSYQTSKLKQLAQAVAEGNVYAQARGASNIESLASQITDFRKQLQAGQTGRELQRQLTEQQATLDRAANEVARLRAQPQAAAELSNRARLSTLYEDQQGRRATNVVDGLADNFDDTPPDEETVADEAWFDRGWLERNALIAEQEDDDGEERAQRRKKEQSSGRDDSMKAPSVAQQDRLNELESKSQIVRRSRGRRAPEPSAESRAGRYRESLEQQLRDAPPRSGAAGAGGGRFGGSGGQADNGRFERMTQSADGGLARGLASLDVELPERGVEYRFTTPRGDIEIGARSISGDWLKLMRRLLAVAVGAILIALLWRAARRLRWSVLLRPRSLVAMLIAGLALLAFGVVPVLGGLMIAGAVVAFALGGISRRTA